MAGKHRAGRRPAVETLPSGEATPDTLMSQASKALMWSFVNTAASRLGTLGIGIVLARLLGPKEFGTYAVGLVALTAVLSFNELGVSLAIVRWPGDPRTIAPTVNTISLISSAVIGGLSWVFAPQFAAAMNDPGATTVVRLLGLTVIMSGAVATPVALLQRGFRQDRKLVIDQVNSWLGAIISVALVLAGFGAISLAIGRLAGSSVSGIMYIRAVDQPYRFGWNRSEVKPLLHFGLPLAGASIVVFFVGYVDQLIVGQALGSIALGAYVLATNLSGWPVQMFSQPLRSVAPAAFARIQHDPEMMRSTLQSLMGVLTALTIPICVLVAVTAKPLIAFVYGPAWAAAAAPLSWLAILAALRIFYELAYDYFVVLGTSRAVFALQVIWLVALVPSLLVGAHGWGLAGVGAAQVVVAGGLMLPLYLWQYRRSGVSPVSIVRRIAPSLGASALVAGIALVFVRAVPSGIIVVVLSGLIACLAIGLLLYRDRAHVRRLRGSPAPVLVA